MAIHAKYFIVPLHVFSICVYIYFYTEAWIESLKTRWGNLNSLQLNGFISVYLHKQQFSLTFSIPIYNMPHIFKKFNTAQFFPSAYLLHFETGCCRVISLIYCPFFIYFLKQRECFVMSTNVKSGIGTWAKKSCNERCGYICLRNVGEWIKWQKQWIPVVFPKLCVTSFSNWVKNNSLNKLFFLSTDPLIPDDVKPIIYTDYVPVINDTFRLNTQEMSWNAAKRFCESEGAKLASLRNEWAKSYSHMMSLNLNTPLWIGLNRKAV